jgi:hypothetical protein
MLQGHASRFDEKLKQIGYQTIFLKELWPFEITTIFKKYINILGAIF